MKTESLLSFAADYPLLSLLLTLILCAWLGNTIMTQYLLQKQIRSITSKVVFVVTFSCSLSLLSMYLFQISALSVPELYWDIILSIVVFMCVFFIPICLIWRYALPHYKLTIRSIKVPVIAMSMAGVYLTFLFYMYSEIKAKKQFRQGMSLMQCNLNILIDIVVKYGVYMMALMSAYGSVWCPFIYFNLIQKNQKKLLKEAKSKIRDQIHFIIDQMKSRKYQLLVVDEKMAQMNHQLELQKENKRSFINSLVKLFATEPKREEFTSLKQKKIQHQKQLETLKKAHEQSYSVYRDIMEEQKKHLLSETLYGQVSYILAFVLAVYSVTKFLLTLWNMVKGRKLSTDPITRSLNWISFFLSIDVDETVRSWSQYISFAFMGYLMISNVRSFSMNVKNVLNYITKRKFNILETETQVYFFSLIYGIYFLAAVILLQSGLPRNFVTNFQHMTGKLSLVDHFSLFDVLYFWMCLGFLFFAFYTEIMKREKMKQIIGERNLAI